MNLPMFLLGAAAGVTLMTGVSRLIDGHYGRAALDFVVMGAMIFTAWTL